MTIGWLLIAITALAAGTEVAFSVQAEAWRPIRLGEVWANFDLASLNLVQAVVQRHLHPMIWEPGIVTVLLFPIWAVTLVPGLIVVFACRGGIGRRSRSLR